MSKEICRCAESLVHVVRNFDEAMELSKTAVTMGRALIHASYVKEELPKIGECLGVDFSRAVKLIEEAEKVRDRPTEATGYMELAWTAFMRTLRACTEKK
jgi:hypothetical protein